MNANDMEASLIRSAGLLNFTNALACTLLIGLMLISMDTAANQPILPVPQPLAQPIAQVSLGEKLFHDKRLSADNTISCASCHDLTTHGADPRPFSVGVAGALGNIRSPSVYNSALNLAQFWDGRAADLTAQVDGPIHDPREMASDWPSILNKLAEDPRMLDDFQHAFSDGLTADNVRAALVAFQHTLLLTDSPFDLWLAGDPSALNSQELRGYGLFRSYGCISCHQGANVGGNMYARMGSLENYFELKGENISQADLGRYNVTGHPSHRYVFKVPGLRTAALNSFFFHDASASSLEEAIEIMGRFQLGRQISPMDIDDIAAFIRSLTGQHPLRTANEGDYE